MMRISVPEFGRIPRSQLGRKLLNRLQAFDEKHASSSNECVFDWNHFHDIRAQNYVGVIQIPGLIVEILPKIDKKATEISGPYQKGDQQAQKAQHNLLYMLSFTKKIPIRERDLASLRLQKMPLLEAMATIFVEQLLGELRKGLDHSYVAKEENARYLKGKLLVSQHLRHNAVHQERVYIGYEDFIPDTWLNRVLKAACYRLLDMVSGIQTQKRLREALLYFSDVSDRYIYEYHFNKVHLTRNTSRFETLLDFSKVILLNSAPGPSVGTTKTFSLLFPMETLFEEFIARFISRYCEHFEIPKQHIHVQAKRRSKWLLRRPDKSGCFRLRPDIIIDKLKGITSLIIDTKWKHLKSDQEDSRNGVSQADLYQLYAYAQRYDSNDNVLLFPQVNDVTPKEYYLADEPGKKLRVDFVDLNFDLVRNKKRLQADINRILNNNQTMKIQ